MSGLVEYLASLARALALTSAVEGLLVLLIFRRWRYVYYSVLCNLLTNPALNVLLSLGVFALGAYVYTPLLILLELAVLLIEAYVYRLLCGFSSARALTLSALLNASSFCAGLLIQKAL